ncbi:hypothetical protein [Sphingomonas sp.]|nr:hypothetical protein [Sphingomonas sp.]
MAILAASCGSAAVVVDGTAPIVGLPHLAVILRVETGTIALVVGL